MTRHRAIRFLAALAAALPTLAIATEGGASSFPRGGEDFLVAAMPPPGWYALLYGTRYAADKLAGREKEIGEGMANVYATEFSEQELKDLVTFFKTPLGQKLLTTEPRAIQSSMAYMNTWAQNFAEIVNGEFRAEMRKRGKQI